MPVLLALLAFLAPALPAQEVAQARLRGVVTVGDSVTGLDGAQVVLHRVDPVEAGEIDSLRTAADGGFGFILPGVPDPEGRQEVYFASVRHQGVLYFGPPVASAIQLDSLYRIQVYDTVNVGAAEAGPVLALRYMLVEAAEDGGWQATDLLQLEVAGRRTLMAGPDSVTWRYPLPPGVRNVRVGGSDVAGETARFRDGVVEVAAPLTPGMRQVVLRYDLDSLAATVPLPGGVPEMELLVRDDAPPLEVEGLLPTGTVALEDGVLYRRYVGRDLTASSISFRAGEEPFEIPLRWLAVFLGLVFAAAAVFALKRGGGGSTRPAGAAGVRSGGGAGSAPGAGAGASRAPGDRAALVREIAELDLALEEVEDAAAEATLRSRRRALMERLRSAG